MLATFIFAYLPMVGFILAFKNYDVFSSDPLTALFNSPWAANYGLQHFIDIFMMPSLLHGVLNTLYLSILTLVIGFPMPIILALSLNELRTGIFKKTVQTISYLPHFLSIIAIVGIATSFLASNGALNDFLQLLFGKGYHRIMFLSIQNLFVPNVLFIGIWITVGWNSILYLAAIAGIDSSLYEAARMDGASRWKQLLHITLPSIMPTAVILFIMNMGTLFSSNFQLIYGLQNPYINFETIDTLVYKNGIGNGQFSASIALNFLQGVIALILVASANKIAKKVSEVSLW